jgi:hypothetical protein
MFAASFNYFPLAVPVAPRDHQRESEAGIISAGNLGF